VPNALAYEGTELIAPSFILKAPGVSVKIIPIECQNYWVFVLARAAIALAPQHS
jgi:hypothetical protein